MRRELLPGLILTAQRLQRLPVHLVRLEVVRNGKTKNVRVTLGKKGGGLETKSEKRKKKKKSPKKYRSKKLGLLMDYGWDRQESKSVVRITESTWDKSQSGSPQAGDVLLKINTVQINDISDVKKAEKKVRKNDEVLLFLSRRGTLFYTSITVR